MLVHPTSSGGLEQVATEGEKIGRTAGTSQLSVTDPRDLIEDELTFEPLGAWLSFVLI